MSAAAYTALSAVWLAAGFAFVLWGLKIFRGWVLMVGAVGGAVIGGAIAVSMVGENDAAVAGALAGAAIGGFAAWPMQRVMVFLSAGLITATVAAAAAVAFAGSDYVAGFAIAGFLAGGLAAAALYEVVIISAMAFTGSQAVFHAAYVPATVFTGRPEDIAGRILAIYAAQFVTFVAGAALFVAFALWYQRGPGRKRERAPAQAARAVAARRVSVRLAVLCTAAWIAAALLVAAGFWPVSTYELVGMHPLSWPVVALAALAFTGAKPVIVTEGEGDSGALRRGRSRGRLLRTVVFAAIVPPVVTASLFVMLGASWDGLVDYYLAFLAGPPPVVAAKWTFSLALLPLLLFRAHPVVVLPAEVETAEDGAGPDPEGATAEGDAESGLEGETAEDDAEPGLEAGAQDGMSHAEPQSRGEGTEDPEVAPAPIP